MRASRITLLTLTLMAVVFVQTAGAVMQLVRDGVVSGRVVQTMPDGRVVGVSGLQVKLISPVASNRPALVSLTNGIGRYGFARQPKGQYLFEIYRGHVLLYRRVLDTTHDSDSTISLKRRL